MYDAVALPVYAARRLSSGDWLLFAPHRDFPHRPNDVCVVRSGLLANDETLACERFERAPIRRVLIKLIALYVRSFPKADTLSGDLHVSFVPMD